MAIEKKSLISNRTASKKAIVTKPEVTKAVSTRLAKLPKLGTGGKFHLSTTSHFRMRP